MDDGRKISHRRCSVEGGEGKHLARGYCPKHYRQNKKSDTPCSVPGCGKPMIAREYCTTHYPRFMKFGDPLRTKVRRFSFSRPEELREYIRGRVAIGLDGCWIWPV